MAKHQLSDKELSALISLLDDPDEEIYSSISIRLMELGNEAIPALENAWEQSFDSLLQNRIEAIIHKIQFDALITELVYWRNNNPHDLLQGALLIARYQYPDLDEAKIRKQIDTIKQDVWLELNENLTALEKVRIINHILFDVHFFTGNRTNYHAPQNSYINNVLEAKRGSPLSLGIIYLIIAQSLEIPIYGINLPEHFVLAYRDEHRAYSDQGYENGEDLLFYINPFSKGMVFTKREVFDFIAQLKLSPLPEYYTPCDNLEIVKRMVRNLILSYNRLGYPNKIDELSRIMRALL